MTKLNKSNLSPATFIGANEEGVISFGSGQPDLPPPDEVYQILPRYRDFKYGSIQGMAELRSALAEQYPHSSARDFVITNGASEALDISLRVISRINNGKPNKILVTKPYYYSYPHLIRFAGMEPVYLKTTKGHIDVDDLKAKVKDCKAIIINSPSNPTGRVEDIATLKLIEELTAKSGVFVISDEVYKELIYVRDNYLIKGPHVVTINSFSKTYAMCGFRVGYLWSLDQDFIKQIIAIKTHSSMNTNILGQEMALEATKVPKSFIQDQLAIWKSRRDLLFSGLESLGFDLWNPEGAFYMLPKVDKPLDFVWDLYSKYDVITYLGDWFGAPGRVRFSYALDSEKITEGLERISKYLNSTKSDQ